METRMLLNVAGVLLLVAGLSGAAVVKDEGAGGHGGGGGGGLARFTVTWPVTPGELADQQGRTNDGAESAATAPVNQANLTTVTVRLTWTDNYRLSGQSPASVTLNAGGPGVAGREMTSTDGRGGITLDFPIRSPPNETTVEATSEKEAAAKASRGLNATAGTGSWNITISVARDYRAPVHPTGSVSWTLAVSYQSFTVAVKKAVSG